MVPIRPHALGFYAVWVAERERGFTSTYSKQEGQVDQTWNIQKKKATTDLLGSGGVAFSEYFIFFLPLPFSLCMESTS